MDELKTCELCRSAAPLRASHVVPAFVNRWLRDSSPGHLRAVTAPNRRIQDGPTREWLCDKCEQLLSSWEKPFAEQVFQYVHTTSETQKPVPYGEWALKFAASVSWRTALYYRDAEDSHLSDADRASLAQAQAVWRDFMLGKRPHPAEFEQHVILVDAIQETHGAVSPFINRYLLRTIGLDVITSPSFCVTHTKLCRVIVVGFVRVKTPRRWKGTKLHVRSGQIGGDCHLPSTLVQYWNDKADQAAAAMAAMSDKQKGKIEDVFAKADQDELSAGENFRAMQADVRFSGNAAFTSTARRVRGDDGAG